MTDLKTSLSEAVGAAFAATSFAAVINCGAHTAVDKAESEPELAHRINAEAPAVLAREAAACGALLVYYSSDYLFDSSGQRPPPKKVSAPLCGLLLWSSAPGLPTTL